MTTVTMTHAGVTGTAVVTVEAFNAVWDALGWEIVEPDATGVYLPADMHYRGAWSSSIIYAPGDVVSYSEIVWVCLEPSVNDTPGVAPEWETAATSTVPVGTYAPVASPTLTGTLTVPTVVATTAITVPTVTVGTSISTVALTVTGAVTVPLGAIAQAGVAGLAMTNGTTRAGGDSCLGSLTTGSQITASGQYAGLLVTSGSRHVLIGRSAGAGITTTHDDVAVGWLAGKNGFECVSVGGSAGALLDVTAWGNTLVGYFAGGQGIITGAFNTAVGHFAGANLTNGGSNVAVGRAALRTATSATYMVAVGHASLYYKVSGTECIGIGDSAGGNELSTANGDITGNRNIWVGTYAGPTADGFSNVTVVGNYQKATQSNTVIIGGGTMLVTPFTSYAQRIGLGGNPTAAAIGDVEIVTAGGKLYYTSPDGTKYGVSVANGGVFSYGATTYASTAGATFTGAVLLPDTAVSAPSLAWAGDTDTGLDWMSANRVAMATNGVSVMEWLAASIIARVTFNPGGDSTIDLGAGSLHWRDIYGGRNLLACGGSGLGGGVGVMAFGNATTVPTTNPTGGFIGYGVGGDPAFRTSSGKVITLTQQSVAAAATDAASTQTLANSLRTAYLAQGLGA